MTEKTVEQHAGLPWRIGSRSRNLAEILIKNPLPRDTAQRKGKLLALSIDYGASQRTLESVISTLKRRGTFPDYVDFDDIAQKNAQDGTKLLKTSQEISRETADASRENVKAVETSQENVVKANFNADVSAINPQPARETADASQETAEKKGVPPASTAVLREKNVTSQETASQGNALVLPPEVLDALKKISVLDEKFNSLPEMIKQSTKDYVQGIGGPALTNPDDVEMQANLKIEEGSAVARMVYLTPKTLLYFDFSRGRGFKGNLSEFLNNFVDSWFKRQDIKVGVIEKQEWGD